MNQFVGFGVHFLETLFLLGLLGAVGVVLVSSVGDVRDLFLRRERRPAKLDSRA